MRIYTELPTASEGFPIIGVRIALGGSNFHESVTQCAFPKSNRIATDILRRLLVAKLEAAGIEVAQSLSSLPFNFSIYFFYLADADQIGKAMSIIHQELTQSGIEPAIQIAWMDWRECIWRLAVPKSGIFVMPTPEEMAGETEVKNALHKLYEVLTKHLGEKG